MWARMLSLGYHGNKMGSQSRCQQHRNQDESADDSSSGGGTDQATVAPVCTLLFLAQDKLEDRDPNSTQTSLGTYCVAI